MQKSVICQDSGGYMPRRWRLYANNCQIAISRSNPLQGSDKNRAGRQNISVGQSVWGVLRICTVMGNTEAWKQLNWYSPNSDLTVTRRWRLYAKTAKVICQFGRVSRWRDDNQTTEQGKIGLLSQWTMEGWDEQKLNLLNVLLSVP